ncbi:gliding motility protein GldN [Sphingobacterium sp. UT-1RO-CII-1]|uniref:type IX secretion system ring protein PorN/GldN n=1 Tax=Sphingobacterium sp. UT-1RO-CII-1 TaxID=2995225 RepID=UPI00227A9988|nr:gliding motility protein GldN [Sphingobacterium sp. UT-1RO-CII-1]MCY4781029.1 gliding motility protein GldN [Sphingobacterium sp. UT-1RO-CII-1]
MKRIVFTMLTIAYSSMLFAQQENLSNSTKPIHADEPPVDGYLAKEDIASRKVVPYATVRQADIAYSKRVWREIDLREKMNKAFLSPKSRLMDIIMEAIMKGELTAYDPTPTENDPNGDSFKNILPTDQVMARFGGDSILVEEYNENNEVISSRYEARAFSGENVIKFRIKEDWIFDKQRSVFEPRIIGIAPLITPQIPGMDANSAGVSGTSSSGEQLDYDPFDPFAVRPESTGGTANVQEDIPVLDIPSVNNDFVSQIDPTPAFWIYFPEARHIFVNREVVNRNNDATGLSYDDVFIKRMFSSYIVKESNPEDLRIKDYVEDGLARLFESERIKKSLMDYEQDLWSY